MGKSLKKVLSLVMIALLVITSTPAMSFAVEAFSIGVNTVTSNSAKVTLNNTTPGASYTAVLNHDGSFDKANMKLVGLEANKSYKVTITETVNRKKNTAEATFTTKETPKLTLVVGTGGIVKIGDDTYGPGTRVIYTNAAPKNFSGKSYSNAGYTGGVNLNYVFEAVGHATWTVNFANASAVYGKPYYDHSGYFSGYNTLGADIGNHNPQDDLLSASFTAAVEKPVYSLGQSAKITLNVSNINGDRDYDNRGNEYDTHELNEVDIFLNNDSSNDLLVGTDTIENSKAIVFNYSIPTTESTLVGFTKGAVVGDKTIYTKVINFDLVDRYNGSSAAAIIKTSTCTITVEVPLPVYIVAFDSNGGTPAPINQNIILGSLVAKPSNPAKNNFTFDYWTLNNVEYNFTTPVTGPLTLVAKYTELAKHAVTFDSVGGTPAPAGQNIYTGSKVDKPADPSKANFKFDYWMLGEVEYDFATPVTGPLTLVAKYTELAKHAVTFDSVGGTPAPAGQNIYTGSNVDKPADPSKANFKFDYWMLGEVEYNFATPVTGPLTLVAKYTEVEKHAITFDSKGGTPAPIGQNIYSGGLVEKPVNPSKANFTFNYWTLYDVIYEFNTLVTGPLTLVANYTADEVPTEKPTEKPTEIPTEAPTQAPTQAPTEAPTQVVQPTSEEDDPDDDVIFYAVVASTEASTEILPPEEVALGEAKIVDFDSFQSNLAQETTEEVVEELTNEATPLADALPKTGQLPVEVFYGIGGLISAAGVFLKRKK